MQITRNALTRNVVDLDRIFDEFFVQPAAQACASAVAYAPNLELSETEDGFVVRAELAGLAPEDVQVTIEEDVLTIRGEKKSETKEGDGKVVRSERRYGKFSRTVEFGMPVDAENATATHRNGLLVIRLQKHPRARARQVKIETE
jgi:HSP20 family protein